MIMDNIYDKRQQRIYAAQIAHKIASYFLVLAFRFIVDKCSQSHIVFSSCIILKICCKNY